MYKKREIRLQPEADYEFRRVESSLKSVGFQRYDYIAKGGERKTTIAGGYLKGSLLFFVNGVLKKPNEFYREINPESGEIEHMQLNANDWVFIMYQK